MSHILAFQNRDHLSHPATCLSGLRIVSEGRGDCYMTNIINQQAIQGFWTTFQGHCMPESKISIEMGD